MVEHERKGEYSKLSRSVNDWLKLHNDETFDLDTICRQLNVNNPNYRNYITIILNKLVNNNIIFKDNKLYKYINRDIKVIPWWEASSRDEVNISFPRSYYDDTQFDFGQYLVTRPGDLWVLAGVSNKGKSTFARGLLWENMDTIHCRMMVSEYAPGRFKSVVSRMNWRNPMKEDGTPKFDLIERHSDWKYAIEPDSLNIIDWIALNDKFWQIRDVMEGIQDSLRGGIAVVVLQKSESKGLGEGGSYSEQRASVYLNIDSGLLTVRKIKETRGGRYFDGLTYGFEIIDGGAGFSNIREVKKCLNCQGKGSKYDRSTGGDMSCANCKGTGYRDAVKI